MVNDELLRLGEPEALGVTLSDRDAVNDVDTDAPKLKDKVGDPDVLPDVDAATDADAAADTEDELLRLGEPEVLSVTLPDKDDDDDEDADAPKLKDDVGNVDELTDVDAVAVKEDELVIVMLSSADAATDTEHELLRLSEPEALGVTLPDRVDDGDGDVDAL